MRILLTGMATVAALYPKLAIFNCDLTDKKNNTETEDANKGHRAMMAALKQGYLRLSARLCTQSHGLLVAESMPCTVLIKRACLGLAFQEREDEVLASFFVAKLNVWRKNDARIGPPS